MSKTLFSSGTEYTLLPHKVRPKTIKDFVGQAHLIGNSDPHKSNFLELFISPGSETSAILYGPPGCGKTTLANIIAHQSNQELITLNGSQCSINDVRKTTQLSIKNKELGIKTTLLIDEIHRFNKAQQDSLLEPVEQGSFRFIGATTENPFFGVSSPLISRCLLIELKQLANSDITKILRRAIEVEFKDLIIKNDALNLISERSNGDARIALNFLELAYKHSEPNVTKGNKIIDLKGIKSLRLLAQNIARHDKNGENHYDQISAFIKSMRGSDPNASLYWLGRLIYSGEDPLYIARRLVVHAAEDVGLADPTALQSAIAAQRAVETIGMPEAKIPLAMATLHIALAPKSNSSCIGIKRAMEFIEKGKNSLGPVPNHLKDSHYLGAEYLGNGSNYLFPHLYSNGYVEQNYLPENLKNINLNLYEASNIGYEEFLVSALDEKIKQAKELKELKENNQNANMP